MSKIISSRHFTLASDIVSPIHDGRCSAHRGNVRGVDVFPAGLAVQEVIREFHYGQEKEFLFKLPGTSARIALTAFDDRRRPLHDLFVAASEAASGKFAPETIEQAAAVICGGDEQQFLSCAVEQLVKWGKVSVADLVKAYKAQSLVDIS